MVDAGEPRGVIAQQAGFMAYTLRTSRDPPSRLPEVVPNSPGSPGKARHSAKCS
jgi:hypothetical protein